MKFKFKEQKGRKFFPQRNQQYCQGNLEHSLRCLKTIAQRSKASRKDPFIQERYTYNIPLMYSY